MCMFVIYAQANEMPGYALPFIEYVWNVFGTAAYGL